jgi:hypothetical protein
MYNSLLIPLNKLMQYAFDSLGPTNQYYKSSDENSMDSPVREGTFQTSNQARSVLLKSENLCKRVTSLVSKLSSNQISQDSYESISSSRVNLHIPKISLNNTPLSPISMGGLDTDRITSTMDCEQQEINDYECLLAVWKNWKEYYYSKRDFKLKFTLASRAFYRKSSAKAFNALKASRDRSNYKARRDNLACGSYVQRALSRVVAKLRNFARLSREKKAKVKLITAKRAKKIVKAWKDVCSKLLTSNSKVRSFRDIYNRKCLKKYFKLFVIISMISSRQNRQKQIAEAFNRDRLLKLGFQHISLSVFTNTYYHNLYILASTHCQKHLLKKFFNKTYMKTLILKRIRILKQTANQIHRKSSLLKGMRRLYSYYSIKKSYKTKKNDSDSYYTSNLYLKTLVSWHNYHSNYKQKKKKYDIGDFFFKNKILSKYMTMWKKWFPVVRRTRIIRESIQKEKKYWILKEFLLEWTVKTRKRTESRKKFGLRSGLRKQSLVFNAWKEYIKQKIAKIQYENLKRDQFLTKIAIRAFNVIKKYTKNKRKIKNNGKSITINIASKFFKLWRIKFLRKVTLSPIIIKTYCKYIFKRWRKYAQKSSIEYKKLFKANKHYDKELKSKVFYKWQSFFVYSKKNQQKKRAILDKKHQKICKMIVLVWKSVSLGWKLDRLKLEKSENHYFYNISQKVFRAWTDFASDSPGDLKSLIESWHISMIRHYSIRKNIEKTPDDNTLNHWKLILLKSKGLNSLFYSKKKSKIRSEAISCILDNKLNLEPALSYFKKDSVIAYQERKRKTTKKIFGLWVECVEKSKKKLKIALSLNKKSKVKLSKSIIKHWVLYTKTRALKHKKALKKSLMQKADEFFRNSSHLKFLLALQNHLKCRNLESKGVSLYNLKMKKKGIVRWSSYYFNYLKLMKKAAVYNLNSLNQRKAFCIKKWLYVSHLSSWKARAEQRLFFYWDRRLKRILGNWNKIVVEKFNKFEKIWNFRAGVLKSKGFKGLKMTKGGNQKRLELKNKANHCNIFMKKRKILKVLKNHHNYSRKKVTKLTLALNFRYYTDCTKFFGCWESYTKHISSKKSRLSKIYTNYMRTYGLSKCKSQNKSLIYLKKQNFGEEYEYLNNFLTSSQSLLPKNPKFYLVSIFTKWRSLVGFKYVDYLILSKTFYLAKLKKKMLKSWRKLVTIGKARRKTIRAAIIFYRQHLKKKVLSHWKPKKIIKRRK